MSTEPTETNPAGAAPAEPIAKQAPTEQQESRPGTPKKFAVGQTVCNEKNEKGKLCNGHLKEMHTAHLSEIHLRGDDALHQCQTCGTLYVGPPMGHVRDARKQRRYVERDLAAILRAAGGTLPAYDYPTPNWKPPVTKRAATTTNSEGAQLNAASPSPAAVAPPTAEVSALSPTPPAAAPSAARPATPPASPASSAAPVGDETPEQKRARLAAELRAKYAGAVKPAVKKATPPDESAATPVTSVAPASPASPASPVTSAAPASPAAAEVIAAPEGETPEQKRDRLRAELKAKYTGAPMPAKKAPAPDAATAVSSQEAATAAASSEATTTTSETTPTHAALDSSSSADLHRPAAEAQAATGQASAAPLSPAAATASPAAGVETVSDLAPEASTELTPGAPQDERAQMGTEQSAAAPPPPPAPRRAVTGGGSHEIPIPAHLLPPPGETMEEKIARLKAQMEAGKNRAE